MYIDIFFACTLSYLITKVQPLDHIMTSLLPERSATAIRKAFLRHIGFYGQWGIRISALLSNNEQGITSLGLQFGGAKIALTQSGPGMHVPQVERSIRAVIEGTRGILHTLPFNCPLVLFAHLPVRFFYLWQQECPFSRALRHYCHVGRSFNAKIDGDIQFGSYCQVSDTKMSNSMKACT